MVTAAGSKTRFQGSEIKVYFYFLKNKLKIEGNFKLQKCLALHDLQYDIKVKGQYLL